MTRPIGTFELSQPSLLQFQSQKSIIPQLVILLFLLLFRQYSRRLELPKQSRNLTPDIRHDDIWVKVQTEKTEGSIRLRLLVRPHGEVAEVGGVASANLHGDSALRSSEREIDSGGNELRIVPVVTATVLESSCVARVVHSHGWVVEHETCCKKEKKSESGWYPRRSPRISLPFGFCLYMCYAHLGFRWLEDGFVYNNLECARRKNGRGYC